MCHSLCTWQRQGAPALGQTAYHTHSQDHSPPTGSRLCVPSSRAIGAAGTPLLPSLRSCRCRELAGGCPHSQAETSHHDPECKGRCIWQSPLPVRAAAATPHLELGQGGSLQAVRRHVEGVLRQRGGRFGLHCNQVRGQRGKRERLSEQESSTPCGMLAPSGIIHSSRHRCPPSTHLTRRKLREEAWAAGAGAGAIWCVVRGQTLPLQCLDGRGDVAGFACAQVLCKKSTRCTERD